MSPQEEVYALDRLGISATQMIELGRWPSLFTGTYVDLDTMELRIDREDRTLDPHESLEEMIQRDQRRGVRSGVRCSCCNT